MKLKFSSIIVISIIVLEILFVIACFWASYNFIDVPEGLIMYWHITFVAELFACAGIKVSKVIAKKDEKEEVMG